jgi:hypothetical protein
MTTGEHREEGAMILQIALDTLWDDHHAAEAYTDSLLKLAHNRADLTAAERAEAVSDCGRMLAFLGDMEARILLLWSGLSGADSEAAAEIAQLGQRAVSLREAVESARDALA